MNETDLSAPEERKPRGASRKKGSLAAASIEKEVLRRVPPHSEEAETGVLAGIFMRPDLMNSFSDSLRPDDFYLPAHAEIYQSCLNLFGKNVPITSPAVAEELKGRQALEKAGGAVYLARLEQAVMYGANAEYFAGIVRDRAMQRRLIDTCVNILSNCYEPGVEVPALLDESEQSVFSIATRNARTDFVSSKDLMSKVFENLSKLAGSTDTITGITTGFSQLDKLTSGLQNSDLIIVAARPSMGKTAFALCAALNAAIKQNLTVAIFSLEMSSEQLMHRLLSIRSKINLSSLRRPASLKDEDWAALYDAADVINKASIFIDDSPALSTLELRARARRIKAEHGLGLVVIDYLQLMRSSRKTDSRELEISDISRSLKALAKELNIPVMALAQLNRKLEDRTDKRPILADLRESGAIEQDADVIMFVYRDDVYKFKKPSERPTEGEAEIIIGKQRNGPVGVAELMYLSQYTAFESKAYDNYPAES